MTLSFHPVPGMRLGTAAAGIRYPDRQDLLLVEISRGRHLRRGLHPQRLLRRPRGAGPRHLAAAAPR